MNLDSIDKEFIKRSLANPDGSRPDSNVTHSVFRRTLDRPRSRPEKLPGVGKIGAVLVLFYCGPNEELQFLLTKRSSRLNHHAGQISLPGGRRDPNESIEQTAIRETVEEVNASQTQIELLGRLEPVYIPPSDFTVHPMVAWYDPPIQFVAAEDEVEEILEVRFELIARSESEKFGSVETKDGVKETGFFLIGGHQVWGATAIILFNLLQRLGLR